ncbi:MAG: SpoIIE family protein phosphatase, partial [Actinomycetota bacterium]
PLLVRDGQATSIGATGPLIGMVPNTERPVVDVELRSGDQLVVYTDGVLEGGDERIDTPELARRVPTGLPLGDLLDWMMQQAGSIDIDTETADDVTVLGVEIL